MAEQALIDITTLRRSPLSHLENAIREGCVAGERGVSLREIPFLNMVGLRLTPGSAAAAALVELTGVPLPAGHGQVTGDPEGIAVLWLGPDEFLLVGPDETVSVPESADALGDEPGAAATLSTHPLTLALSRAPALRAEPGQVVDLSANRTTLELSGPSARAVLEKGCPMDLHPRVFGPGTAVATTLGPVPVLVWQTAEQTYRVLPRASFADYTARWLLDAMREYAAPEVP